MTPEQFQSLLKALEKEFKDLFNNYAPTNAGKTAVRLFKQNFQDEGFFEINGWKEVKRREKTWTRNGKTIPNPTKGAARTRKRLTGNTGDLGRSIEYKLTGSGTVEISTNPGAFGSKEPYGRVHNEGLRAGRGSGFTMPKRQFIGDHPTLRKTIADEIERKLKEIRNS
jgi:phage gpG-like protein